MQSKDLTLEEDQITIRGKTLKIIRPAVLEEVFKGDPFLDLDRFPFWFKIWESSLILADYLSTIEPPKDILEIGAGLGVASLFASSFGHNVVASDYEELPLELLERSASENGLKIQKMKLNWLEPSLNQRFDLIVGAEVIYKRSFYDPLIHLFQRGLKDSGEVILAHSIDRKRILVPFLHRAESFFHIMTSIRRLKGPEETSEIVLNRLIPRV
ncbi:MAG: protein N-lysine methyltransferase family protein [Caldimicrobium sp.]|nr:protein N-lysine methyltransferase family protein [Caldimicrobium sp.]MCX7612641.1 protein N-lysine methyltransferase family protein [Caldimicrobium sp.]MDW8182206.1 methyltransferase [Caldimicrobium sp.]